VFFFFFFCLDKQNNEELPLIASCTLTLSFTYLSVVNVIMVFYSIGLVSSPTIPPSFKLDLIKHNIYVQYLNPGVSCNLMTEYTVENKATGKILVVISIGNT